MELTRYSRNQGFTIKLCIANPIYNKANQIYNKKNQEKILQNQKGWHLCKCNFVAKYKLKKFDHASLIFVNHLKQPMITLATTQT